jgi:hypothetical protein
MIEDPVRNARYEVNVRTHYDVAHQGCEEYLLYLVSLLMMRSDAGIHKVVLVCSKRTDVGHNCCHGLEARKTTQTKIGYRIE